MKLPGTGAIPSTLPAQIGGTLPAPAGVPRAIPRVRSEQSDPRNDSGVRSLDEADRLHKTLALAAKGNELSTRSGQVNV